MIMNGRNYRNLVALCLLSLLLPIVYYKLNGSRWRTVTNNIPGLDPGSSSDPNADPDPDPDPGPEPATPDDPDVDRVSVFEGFDNVTGSSSFIVPNVIHYLRLNQSTLTFVDYVCIRSAYVNHKPRRIIFHTNSADFSGTYWQKIKSERDLYARISLRWIQVPSEIFDQQLRKDWQLYHGSDIGRIQTMMKYGGIYLDNDMYVVASLDKYRRFEIAMGWDQGKFIGNQVIIAHKNARFLPLYLNTYQEYHPELWYYNAGERPTVEILYRRPELLHRVKWKFGVHQLMAKLYASQWPKWRNMDTIHLLISHRYYMDPQYEDIPVFDEVNIANYSYTFGEMARRVLPRRKSLSNSIDLL